MIEGNMMKDLFAAAACSTWYYREHCIKSALRTVIGYYQEKETTNQSTAKEVAR